MIQIKHLSKTFLKHKHEVKALDDVSLEIEKGISFGVIGLSGAGKSSFIRCINRLEKSCGGEIHIDGENILSLSPKALRKKRQKIGMIFQNFNLLSSKTVYENIAFPLELAGWSKVQIQDKVTQLLKEMDLEEKKDMYPSHLSGGQKQRVGIARALALEPNVLLCDEATSALDPKTTHEILNLLKNINREYGVTLVVITHEMSVVKKICSHVAYIEQGKIIESGKTQDVFLKPVREETKRFMKYVNEEEGFNV